MYQYIMTDAEYHTRLDCLEQNIDTVYRCAEPTRTMFRWTPIIRLVIIFFPLIGLPFVIFGYLNTLDVGGLF